MLRNKVAAERLINANNIGRTVAALHVSTNMSDVFGEFTQADMEKHFKGNTLTGMWTKAFRISNMKDLDLNANKSDHARKRARTLDAVSLCNKRSRDVAKTKEELRDIVSFEKHDAKYDIQVKECAENLLRDVKRDDHLLSDRALAFRKDVDEETPNHVDNKTFLQNLQDDRSRTVGAFDENSKFVHSGPLIRTRQYSPIYFILTDMLEHTPSGSLMNTSVGGAVYDKMKRYLRPYRATRECRNVSEVHIHVDVGSFKPPSAVGRTR